MPFPYKTVLVTGATSGIGRALVERMIAAGIFVVAVGRRGERLDELVERHGAGRVAAEPYDVAADLPGMAAWVGRITAAYPRLDCVVLNAGVQRTLDFSRAAAVLADVTDELHTNYLSPLYMASLFLPHLTSLGRDGGQDGPAPSPAGIVLVSSGLAIVPIPRCPNYCASKAALHSFAWTLREQLAANPDTHHVRLVEILPPAVQTELHDLQEDLKRAGRTNIGVPLEPYADETWAALTAADQLDEIVPAASMERMGRIEDQKRTVFVAMADMMRKQGISP